MSDFDRCFQIVVGHEGGYVNNPSDPGGETKFGICKRDYPHLDIKALTIDQAQAIYLANYWQPIKGDSLPWPLCLYVFDCAVNQGVRPAVMMLQQTIDTAQDGIPGVQTIALARKSGHWHWARFLAFRAMRYQGTRNFDRFGEGWLIRCFEIAREGGRP